MWDSVHAFVIHVGWWAMLAAPSPRSDSEQCDQVKAYYLSNDLQRSAVRTALLHSVYKGPLVFADLLIQRQTFNTKDDWHLGADDSNRTAGLACVISTSMNAVDSMSSVGNNLPSLLRLPHHPSDQAPHALDFQAFLDEGKS
jgi:hypothetical protein